MGLLDDLKKEAEAVTAEKAREDAQRQEALRQAHARLEPLMQKLYKYFDELKSHLKVVNREVTTSYRIQGIGEVGDLKQGQYGVSTERVEKIEKFTFRCVCAKSGSYQVTQPDTASVAAYRDYLRDNGLQAKVRDSGQGSATFMVQAAVPVVVEFTADYKRVVVTLRMRNLKGIGVTRHTLNPDVITDKFMDELAKAIIRAPNTFDELVGDALSQTGKIRLKKKLQAAVRQKRIEEEQARKESEREDSITRRFGRTLFGKKE